MSFNLEEAMAQYRRKLDHARLRVLLSQKIPEVLDKAAVTQAQMHRIKMKIKEVLDREGIYPDWHPFYYAYGLALDKSQRTLEFMVDLKREHGILRERWETKGLNSDILDQIDKLLIFRRFEE